MNNGKESEITSTHRSLRSQLPRMFLLRQTTINFNI